MLFCSSRPFHYNATNTHSLRFNLLFLYIDITYCFLLSILFFFEFLYRLFATINPLGVPNYKRRVVETFTLLCSLHFLDNYFVFNYTINYFLIRKYVYKIFWKKNYNILFFPNDILNIFFLFIYCSKYLQFHANILLNTKFHFAPKIL